ncbi:blue-light sensor BLUF [Sphingobium cupriresistens LL01]|uniref:Blue-light sensor BLUF n=3 Tax=Sphingomonadaceae TaxID=41297 RepID=A0A0J7Y291_9SPHN|nr:blue-light sensor BLUF [Sphingobium cupriresistens LL01]
MSMSLYQIMYISTVVGTVTSQQCAAMAQMSAINNRRNDVTGLLLFNSRRFLQVLEGPKDAVDRIFTRIHADPRHRAVVKLREGPIDAREFGEWAMAYDDPARPSADLKDKVAALLVQAGPSTRAHFIGSADLHRPAA